MTAVKPKAQLIEEETPFFKDEQINQKFVLQDFESPNAKQSSLIFKLSI